jgi:carotenoid cleavage dioxygenase
MSTTTAPAPLDPTTVPQLQGVFAPVAEEHDDTNLTVEGELPKGLIGAYLRNGMNPVFTPIGSYTYPLDGDGMIHGLWFQDGAVRYRNRSVQTPHLRAEEAAGHALWAGLQTLYLPGADVVPAELADNYKALPNINVVEHGGRLLALSEGDAPYELTPDLATIGACDFDGGLPGMTAHPKIDPLTGEMVVFRYNIEAPFLSWGVVGADGTVTTPLQPIDIDGAYMIHDFAITASSVVIFVGPLNFDFDAMFAGEGMLSWKPELGMRIAVIDRKTGAVRWIHTDPFWVWHFANAFDRTSASGTHEIVVDYTDWSRPGLLAPSSDPLTGGICRAVLDPAAGTIRVERLSDRLADFARIDDRLTGQEHHAFVATAATPDHDHGQHNEVIHVDLRTGTTTSWDGGTSDFAELCFVPTPDGDLEEGCYVTYRTDRETLESDFVVFAADDIAAGPVARIPLPHRVPAGLHGNWFPHL